MSRSRDMANLGAQAGSGLDASDITTGTLGNTVQDNITRLGAVTVGTLGSSVVFPSDHVIQVQTDHGQIRQTITNATLKIFEADITLQKANSNLWIDFQTWVGAFGSYQDTDLALAIGWKTGTGTSTIGDYTRLHASTTTNLARQQVGSLGVMWNTDTSGVGGSGGIYWTYAFPYRTKVDLGTQSAGTTIRVAFWASSDGNGNDYVIGGPYSGSTTDAGAESWLDIWELAE